MSLVGLVSDVHAAAKPLEEALAVFRSAGVSQVFCLGDIAGYHEQLEETISLLEMNNVKTIIGNHDQAFIQKYPEATCHHCLSYLQQLPTFIDITLQGRRIYFVHAEPPEATHGGIKLMDKQGKVQPDRIDKWAKRLQKLDYDALIVGHTHQVFSEKIGDMLVINPGSTVFNHSCAILHLPDLRVDMVALSGKKILNNWNWSEHLTGDGKR